MALDGTIDTLREQNQTLGNIFTQGGRSEKIQEKQSDQISNLIGVLTGNDLKKKEEKKEQAGIFERIRKAIEGLSFKVVGGAKGGSSFLKEMLGKLLPFIVAGLVALPALLSKGLTNIVNSEFVVKMRTAFSKIVGGLKKKFPKIFKSFDRIINFFKRIKNSKMLKGLFSTVGKVFGFLKKWVLDPLKKAFGSLKKVKGPIARIKGFLLKKGPLQSFLSGFKSVFGLLLKPLVWITSIIAGVRGFIKGFKEGGFLEGLKQGLIAVIDNIFGWLIELPAWAIGWVLKKLGFKELGAKFSNFSFSEMLEGITDWFTITLPNWIVEKIDAIKTWWKEWTSKSPFGAFLGKVVDIVTWPYRKIAGFFLGAYDYVVGLFGEDGTPKDGEKKEGMFDKVLAIIAWPYKKIAGFFTGAYDYVVGLFGGDGEEVEGVPKKEGMFDKILEIMALPVEKIKGFFTGAYDYVVGLFGGGKDADADGKGIVPSISDMFGGVADIFTFVSEKIGEFFTKAKDWILDNLPSLSDLIDAIPVVGKIVKWWKGDKGEDKEEKNTGAATSSSEMEEGKIQARQRKLRNAEITRRRGLGQKEDQIVSRVGKESDWREKAIKSIEREKTPKVIELEKGGECCEAILKTLSDKRKTATDVSSVITGGSTVVNQSTGGSTSNTTVVNNNAGNNDSLRALDRAFSPSMNRQLSAI